MDGLSLLLINYIKPPITNVQAPYIEFCMYLKACKVAHFSFKKELESFH